MNEERNERRASSIAIEHRAMRRERRASIERWILIVTLAVNCGTWIYWAGSLNQELKDLRKDFTTLEQRFNQYMDSGRK